MIWFRKVSQYLRCNEKGIGSLSHNGILREAEIILYWPYSISVLMVRSRKRPSRRCCQVLSSCLTPPDLKGSWESLACWDLHQTHKLTIWDRIWFIDCCHIGIIHFCFFLPPIESHEADPWRIPATSWPRIQPSVLTSAPNLLGAHCINFRHRACQYVPRSSFLLEQKLNHFINNIPMMELRKFEKKLQQTS